MRGPDRGTWMWAQAFDLLEQADRLHRHFFQLSREREKGPCWEPPVDLFESEQRLVIIVALSVLHGTLTVPTNVVGGVVAADVVGNGTSTVTFTATQNKIDTTLAAAGGLTLSRPRLRPTRVERVSLSEVACTRVGSST